MLTQEEQEELLILLEEEKRRHRYRLFDYTLTGENAKRYAKAAGLLNKTEEYPIVAFFGANRCGKSICGAKWVTTLATGLYNPEYTGVHYDHPVNILCLGVTHAQLRDVIQLNLLGEMEAPGTGMIPQEAIVDTISAQGVSGGVAKIVVQWHKNGKPVPGMYSYILLRASEQGKKAIEGITADAVWIDEECDMDVYNEALTRCLVSGGIVGEKKRGRILITMTPDHGFTDLMQRMMPTGKLPYNNISPTGAYLDVISMYDVPHFTPKQIESIKSQLQQIYIKPKVYGLPDVSSGSVYPIPEETYLVSYTTIPDSHPRAFSIDPGCKNVGIVWAFKNENTGVITVYDEWLQYEYDDLGNLSTPATVPASVIRSRGAWMVGACDPAGNKTKVHNNYTFLKLFKDEGVSLVLSNNAVEPGIDKVYQAFTNGKLKVMENCHQLRNQLRMLRRDDNGNIVKANDHLPDALRYLIMCPTNVFRVNPIYDEDDDDDMPSSRNSGGMWY